MKALTDPFPIKTENKVHLLLSLFVISVHLSFPLSLSLSLSLFLSLVASPPPYENTNKPTSHKGRTQGSSTSLLEPTKEEESTIVTSYNQNTPGIATAFINKESK